MLIMYIVPVQSIGISTLCNKQVLLHQTPQTTKPNNVFHSQLQISENHCSFQCPIQQHIYKFRLDFLQSTYM